MPKLTVEVTANDVLEAVLSLSPRETRNLVRDLFIKKLYQPPELKKIAAEGRKATEAQHVSQKTAEEAVKWARSRES